MINQMFSVTLNEALQELEADDVFEDPIDYIKEHPDDKYALELIKQSPGWAFEYADRIVKGRWPEAEPYILNAARNYVSDELGWAIFYADHIVGGRWPELELLIKEKLDPIWFYEYARWVIKGRWPEVEQHIKKDLGIWQIYIKHVMPSKERDAEATNA
jgi:hypothetical protein